MTMGIFLASLTVLMVLGMPIAFALMLTGVLPCAAWVTSGRRT